MRTAMRGAGIPNILAALLGAGGSIFLSAVPARAGMSLGACIPFPGMDVVGQIREFDAAAHKHHPLILFFRPIRYDMLPADLYLPLQIAKTGAVPVIGWENTAWAYADIVAGKYDDYFAATAGSIRDSGGAPGGVPLPRVLISIDAEMNVLPGEANGPEQFKKMWRHIHDIFTRQGADNVEWVWAPSYSSFPPSPDNHHTRFYPGDDFVDWVATTGFNWNDGSQPVGLFDELLNDFLYLYPRKPALIFYMGAAKEDPGAKAAWIREAYGCLGYYPHLKAVIWWNDIAHDLGFPADFRVIKTKYPAAMPAVPPVVTDAYRGAIDPADFLTSLPPYPDLIDWDPGDARPSIDLILNKETFAVRDEIVITADVSPIPTPFHPYVRILTPTGSVRYCVKGLGLRGRRLAYLAGGPYVLGNALSSYHVFTIGFSDIAPGTYMIEGYPVDEAGRRIGPVDRESVLVQ